MMKRDAEGRLHCEDGPAVTDDTGSYAWYWHGKLHRFDGPAVLLMEKGCVIEEQFWVNGIETK